MEILQQDVFEKFLSPFSGHMLEFRGTLYTTVEHAYHAQRFENQELVEKIMAARSPLLAWEIAQKHKTEQRSDWDSIKVSLMEELCRAKMAQHRDVSEALLNSRGKKIIKHLQDPFWGDGLDGTGRNELGKVWMTIRDTP